MIQQKQICPTDKEVQQRRTFEIISKYIGESHNITVELQDDATPHCDPKRKHIVLPRNVKTDCLYPAIAWTMHEGAHCRYTTYDASKVTGSDPTNHEILNAIEDIRIDNKNFRILPNIQDFYEEMVKFLDTANDLKKRNAPVEARVMVDLILLQEGFYRYTSQDPDIEEFVGLTNLNRIVSNGVRALDDLAADVDQGQDPTSNEKKVKRIIKKIRELLYQYKQQQKSPSSKPQLASQGKGQGKGRGKTLSTTKGAHQKGALDLSGVSSNGSTQKIFGELDKNPRGGIMVDPVALKEQTQKQFREILNIKERQIVSQGQALDLDNLTAFFTGDIESLFKDEAVIIVKKSKIIMVLDSSGSMSQKLIDGKPCNEVVASTAKSIGKLLDEARQEGINVDYEVRGFDDAYYKLNQDNFAQEYLKLSGGGTDLEMAFKEAQKELIDDYTIEGKRIVIFITDGLVSQSQIDEMINSILRYNQDIRCMILGVGANPTGDFATRVSGFNIIAHDLADTVLLEAIMETIQ